MKPASGARPSWWQWPTVLSLDAPIVALLWQWLLARSARVPLGNAERFVLGSSVWLAYAADRWIEGWRLAPDQVRTQRHAFYQRWRWPVAVGWGLVLAADLAFAFARLSPAEFRTGLLLLGPVAAYLLSHQLVHRHHPWRAPKEICVAALLGAGVAVFLVAQPGAAWRALAAPLALFVLLCFTNCALISAWEHEVDESHGQTSLSHQFRHGAILGRRLAWLLAVLSALLLAMETGSDRVPVACAGASSLLLALLDAGEPRLGWQRARVLADVALMTPLLPLAAALLS
ncbi:MAG TPA: hypothetical protein VG838_11100 [Opitutaceae bacterium]|nr:hypothetical protein [Opitutaceae bacterium]